MFSKVIKVGTIPPNFLNSILTNNSLYEMFKNDYEANRDYFQNLDRVEYLSAMLDFIEQALFSSNLFNIYSDSLDIDAVTKGKLGFIKAFYDDFLLNEFRGDPDSILKTKFFRGMVFAKEHDVYASKTEEFCSLYEYVFTESLDYRDLVDVLTKEPLRKLRSDEELSLKEFDNICNYVKNNVEGDVAMDIVSAMLKRHAYKTNHIFDAEVVKCLIEATAESYLNSWKIEAHVIFVSEVEKDEKKKENSEDIILDERLIDEFLSLNYTEVFTELFFACECLIEKTILRRDEVDLSTLKVLMRMIANKVDIEKIYTLEDYTAYEHQIDLYASCFVGTLRFFKEMGVDLFQNYITSTSMSLAIEEEGDENLYSYKEISLNQRFHRVFKTLKNKESLRKKFKVLAIVTDQFGNRTKTIDLIKKWWKSDYNKFLIDYLHSSIEEPGIIIDDIIDLTSYKPKDAKLRDFIEQELKYIYVDVFYYSLDSFLKLKYNPKFDSLDYLMDLTIKVNCIKDTPLTHRFIDEALFTIEEKKQNIL